MKDYHLTIPQKNIWNLQKYYGDTSIANICGAVFYREKRNSALLQRSIRLFIQNQSGIRLRFTEENEPHQYIYEENEIDIPIMSFSSMEDFESYAENFVREPIGLMNRPMYRFVVFQMENRSGILVALSHLISDAWTCGLMVNQFDKAYNKLLNNTDEALVEGNYTDYIQSEDNYLCSERYKKDKKYWEEKYAVRPEKSLIKIDTSLSDTVKAKRITRTLPLSLEQSITKYCQTTSVTQAVLFEMAVILYLSKINLENKEITIGVPMLNRSNIREKNIAGMFVSTMPLTTKLEKGMTVSELARQIAIGHIDIFRHQKYPYADILKYLREKQNFSGNLYDVMVSYQNARTDTASDTIWYSNGYSEVPFALHIDNRDGKDSHTINVDYQTAVFKEEAEVGYIIDRLEYIIMQIVGNGNSSIESISILPEQEWKQVVYEFNDTSVDYQREKCVHEFFTKQAQKVPDKVALIFEEKQFTYRQLDEMSNSLAHFLRRKGVKRNDVVPIIAKRSWHVIVAMLGVMKAGGAYMPVAPDYPEDRIGYMLETTESKLALLYGYNKSLSIEQIDLDDLDYFYNAEPLENQNLAEDLCYVLYTSGTTGAPKGIGISHRNLVNFMADNQKNEYQHYAIKNGSIMLASTTFIFDISVFEIYLSLLNGLSIVMANDDEINSPHLIAKLIGKYSVDILHCTPTKLAMLLNNDISKNALKAIKVVMTGAEELTSELYHKISTCTDAAIFNGYGPTEITIGASFKKVEDEKDITIGTPIANTQIYILDRNQNPVPIGAAGELCIAGDGVGKGYLNRPELTAERFIPNPFATKENGHGKTMYRTGDLARFRSDGEIEYLGRIDTQVKIRGLRIELGEIESVVSSFPGIQLCAVTDKRNEDGRQYLVGYYTAEETVDERELRQHLSAKLPKYMIPNYFVRLDKMPVTSSGKIDRKNLPLPDFAAQITEYVMPETETEKKLAVIWQELLQINQVGKTDEFFELGGDSLLAITMLSRLEEEFRTTVSMKDIIKHSTLGKLAQIIAETNYMDDEIVPHHKERYVLLPQQKAIYAVYSKQPETLAYNMSARIALPDFINKERLKNCIETIVNKHQSLKTYISVENDEIYGVYDLDADICFEEYTRDTISDFLRPFDLGKAPLIRIGFAENEFLFDMHHIIADGTSLNIMLKDILRAYSGEGLSDPKIQYSDYAEYFMKKDFASHRDFFKKMLKCEFEPVFLPEKKKLEEPTGISKVFFLTEAVVRDIKSFAVQNELTDTMVYFGAFEILLSKYTAKPDVLTSIILTNRLHKKVQDVVGMFVNTIPVYLWVKGSVKTFFAQLKERILSIYEYQELPFWEIAETVGMKDKSVINTSFVYQGDGEKTLNLGTQELEIELIDTKTAKFDLSMEVTPLKEGCKVRLEYNCAKYEERLIDGLFAAYERILVQLSAEDTENIEDISALSNEERHKVLIEFNDTSVDYQREKCVHELFTEQAQKVPDKVALVFEDKQFTYRQMDEMSNSLAHFLREKGVKRNDVVPIIAKRSWHVIVAMLGVLKAGGAYILIDYQYPMERISYLVQECKSDIVLTYNCTYNNGKCIDLELVDYWKNVKLLDVINILDDALCAIHTSGSSGVPKVAVLTHRNIMHYINYSEEFFEGINQTIATTTITFDAFIQETIVALCRQVSVVLLNDIQMTNQMEYENIINKYKNSSSIQTPTKLLTFIRNSKTVEFLTKIKKFAIGGEVFPQELYDEIKVHNPNSHIYNAYGPTETTIYVTSKRLERSESRFDITIGTPIANTQIYILDQNQKPVPIGVAGELCIAGDGVGKGYLNRPELTAERFIPNPFATKENGHGKTMYRTGDLARFRPDGEIEYLGRIDTQVKIRGLRIELGEIESVMGSFPGIQLNAVTDKRDESDRQYLVGYYTAEGGIDERKLREHLSAKLPKYMIPNYFVRLYEMPVTSSGKIDRKNLPLPDFAAQITEYVMPETETEKKLAAIWQELLQINQVGKTDDFFELGGDSLLAITMLSRLEEEFRTTVSMRDIIEHSTLGQLAKAILDMERKDSEIIPQHKDSYIILPQQKAIYIACSKAPEMMLYNIPTYISLSPMIDREKLKVCIEKTVDRHRSLKTYFSVEKDEIYGIYDVSAKLIFEEYSNQTMSDFFRPFDLNKAPLIRVGFTEDKLLFDIHHIIADGESLNIILKDIFHAYGGEKTDAPEIQYSDYAMYFAEADFAAHKAFFKEMIKCELEPMSLPEKKILTKSGGMSKIFFLSESIIKKTKVYAKRNGLTDTMLYFGAFGILLARYTAREDILTSVVLTNRQHKELKNMVGMFVNTLPAYFAVKGRTHDFFMQIKELVLNLFKYQELPFLEIAEAIGIREKAVINTSFVYQAGGEKALTIGNWKFWPEFVETYTAKFDLSMEVMPSKNGCRVRLEYNCSKYEEKLIDDLFAAYERILAQLSAAGTENIEDISALSSEERYKVLIEFNDTSVNYQREKCVHELFTEQAQKVPDKVALVFEDKQFTYRQMDEMSNSLAHFLREKGVKRNDVVPIIAKRSWHVIVAMLGVLKAGGAFMLIDCQYPMERITYLVNECKADIVLSYGCGYGKNSIGLESVNYRENVEVLDMANRLEDVLCVIHTSGSSGVPKVSILTHRNILHYIHYSAEFFDGVNQAIAATIITFDAFIQETIVALCRQIPVILLNDAQITNQVEFESVINQYEDSFLFQTPTRLLSYIRNSKSGKFISKLRKIVIGGEVFPQELYDKIKLSNPESDIYNIYGPTETTVCVTVKKIECRTDITIGTPIANTQIYILDQNQNPVPIGVVGELCIAGDGVGKGYLNRPKLTAERFIPNPFATKENGHGKIMYRTGDLARFRRDGEIEYLGRIDTQVKIRGLRIELGEIESVMGSFPGIQLNAVTDKRDESDRQYLVGYYTAEGTIDERGLRQHLSAKLPKYMVPNYFVRLDKMPVTSSGKIDRKGLPLPDFTVNNSAYAAPETEQEKLCCDILAELLGYEQIGVEDDFFEIGGDSLRAIEYTAKLHDKGVNLALQNVFDYPTVRKLCDFLESGEVKKVKYQAADFDRYYEMISRNVIDETFMPKKRGLGNVLLTGVTGFLGIHVLDCLMSEESGIIYCLVRSKEKEECLIRIQGILQYYFGDKYESELGNRIIPIEGDIEREGLAEDIPLDVHTVIHTAATVKHYGSYEYFYRVNVEGTRHVADYAKSLGAKMIHISTLSVSGNSMLDELTVYRSEEEKVFHETSFFIGQPLDNVYIHSKFEAEKVIYDAMLDGLDAKVIRVGNLTNRIADFKFQPNYTQNAFLTRVKAILEFGLFPDYLMSLYTEFSPVDLTAEGIVKIAQYAERQNVFHLNSNRPIYYDRLFEILHQLGIPMKVLDGNAFYKALRQTMKDMGTEYIYEALQNDMDEAGRLVYDSNIRIINDFTVWFLKKVGFEWKEIDFDYIRGYIEYFRDIGFLEV